MTGSDSTGEHQSTRPISVAELLARNGTIGSPPVGGRRRRRRARGAGLTVSELTGEIPVVTDDAPDRDAAAEQAPAEITAEIYPETAADTVVEAADDDGQAVYEETVYEETVYEEAVYEETVVEAELDEAEDDQAAESAVDEAAPMVVIYADTAEAGPAEYVADESAEYVADESAGYVAEETADGAAVYAADDTAAVYAADDTADEYAVDTDTAGEDAAVEVVAESPPPLAGDPLPSRRSGGPVLGHDPRPVRRGRAAEQMSPDPVLEAVDLAGLVEAQAAEQPEQRAYLQSPGGTLFGGQTVADDLARSGPRAGSAAGDIGSGRPRPSGLARLRGAVVAIGQSVLAVAFGAGLFIGFDQLWRWNTIVALVLSVLVILGLVVAVRIVRRTEDIASTLIAVAVGALVTLGPLALLQSYG